MTNRPRAGAVRRALLAMLAAAALALSLLPVVPVSAQGGMDVGIVLPSFYALPYTVQPGQTFEIGVSTAPGARCYGSVSFRAQQPIELETQAAPSGTCAWTVQVPGNQRLGTGTIAVNLARNGQSWNLYGVVYVNALGESR